MLPRSFIYVLLLTNFRNCAKVSATLGTTCPDIPRAANHHALSVENTNISLPGDAVLHGLTFNGSWLGPAIYAQLGQDVSIDVINNANVGEGGHPSTGIHHVILLHAGGQGGARFSHLTQGSLMSTYMFVSLLHSSI